MEIRLCLNLSVSLFLRLSCSLFRRLRYRLWLKTGRGSHAGFVRQEGAVAALHLQVRQRLAQGGLVLGGNRLIHADVVDVGSLNRADDSGHALRLLLDEVPQNALPQV